MPILIKISSYKVILTYANKNTNNKGVYSKG